MKSWEDLFTCGKFKECSRILNELLNTEDNTLELSVDSKFISRIQHNKIISDALSHNWNDEDTKTSVSYQWWGDCFTELTNLCDNLKCELLISDNALEVFQVATLNLLLWCSENIGTTMDGFIEQINRLAIICLRNELSKCGESALESESILDLVELYGQRLLHIPPQHCHILLDLVILLFLHMLQYRNCETSRCLSILEDLYKVLPQIHIHLTSEMPSQVKKPPPLILLGPNVASLVSDPDLTVNLVVIVTIIYLIKTTNYDRAWDIISKNPCAKHRLVRTITEYLKAVICLRQRDLDRALYHIIQISSLPMGINMMKRKTILLGWIHILKNNHETALSCLCNSGLSEDEEQLPLHVYLMSVSYRELGQHEQQLGLLRCVVDVLREDPRCDSVRGMPILSLEDRLLRCVHQPPDLTLFQTLVAAAEALIQTSQPEEASDYLLEAVRQTKCSPLFQGTSCDFVKTPSLQSVMRDAVVSFSMCEKFSVARILCGGLTDLQATARESFLSQAVTLILVADVETDAAMEKRQAILLEAIKLLKKHKESILKEETQTSSVALTDSLLARAFYRKAKLYISAGFNEDATVNFNRAVALKEDDAFILGEYERHLSAIGNTDDARKIGDKIKSQPSTGTHFEDFCSVGYITMNYLLGENVEQRQMT